VCTSFSLGVYGSPYRDKKVVEGNVHNRPIIAVGCNIFNKTTGQFNTGMGIAVFKENNRWQV
jgi:hypothetical protein